MSNKLKDIIVMPESDLDVLFELLDFGDLESNESELEDFSVDDIKYKCEFQYGILEDKKTVLTFKFYLIDGPNKPDRKNFATDVQYSIACKRWGIGIVGVKHPLIALKNALTLLVKAIRSKKPDYVSFTANEDNRQRLYKKFFERYGYLIKEYEMSKTDPITGELLGDEEFWLIRKQ